MGLHGQMSASGSDDQAASLMQHTEADRACLQSFMSCTDEQDAPVFAALQDLEPSGQPAMSALPGHQVDVDSQMEGSPCSQGDPDTSQAQWEQRMMVRSLESVHELEVELPGVS